MEIRLIDLRGGFLLEMEECPKCKRMVDLDELMRKVSVYDGRTHICTSCAIREGQSGRVESQYEQNDKLYFQRKRKR